MKVKASSKAVLSGKDFRQLIASLTKLPSIGAFLGSEMLNLEIKDGICYGSSFGIVLSTAQVAVEKGTLPLICVDERPIISFSQMSETLEYVYITVVENNVHFRNTNGRDISFPLQPGKHNEIQPPADIKPLKIDAAMAKKLEYLADVAFSDASMPHLNCVYLTTKKALAVNQKCIAVIDTIKKFKENVAVAIPISKVLGAGYDLFVSPQHTVALNTMSAYTMPSPIQAQQGFPITQALQYFDNDTELIASVNGSDFKLLVADCYSLLSNVSRLEVVLHFSTNEAEPNKLRLKSENGGAKFNSPILTSNETMTAELSVPMEELAKITPFIEDSDTVTLRRGGNGETYLFFTGGSIMFTSYSKPKKKKK